MVRLGLGVREGVARVGGSRKRRRVALVRVRLHADPRVEPLGRRRDSARRRPGPQAVDERGAAAARGTEPRGGLLCPRAGSIRSHARSATRRRVRGGAFGGVCGRGRGKLALQQRRQVAGGRAIRGRRLVGHAGNRHGRHLIERHRRGQCARCMRRLDLRVRVATRGHRARGCRHRRRIARGLSPDAAAVLLVLRAKERKVVHVGQHKCLGKALVDAAADEPGD